jgi:hypothetical protein
VSEIRDELLKGESKGLTLPKINLNKKLILVIPFFVIIWYLSILLFGTNSVLRLDELSDELIQLEESVSKIKHENASLQKELFELKQLRGTN